MKSIRSILTEYLKTNKIVHEPDLRRIAQSYGTEYARITNRLPTGVALFFFHEYNNAKPYFVKFGERTKAWRITGQERGILELLKDGREHGIRELWSETRFGWSKFHRVLRKLQNKGLIEIRSEGRSKKVSLKSNYAL